MLQYLLNLFFPEICLGCDKHLLLSENQLCINCRHEIPLTNHILTKNNEAFKKFYGKLPVENVISMLYYHKRGIVQKLIHNLKYNGHQEIGTLLGNWFGEEIKKNPDILKADYLIPVPLHAKRFKERGYNQVDTFCDALSASLNIPINRNILYRNEYAVSQSKKDLLTRNTIDSLTFDVHNNPEFHNKHFILVDDVLTTGATLETCGKALLKLPNSKISILTMAFSES